MYSVFEVHKTANHQNLCHLSCPGTGATLHKHLLGKKTQNTIAFSLTAEVSLSFQYACYCRTVTFKSPLTEIITDAQKRDLAGE